MMGRYVVKADWKKEGELLEVEDDEVAAFLRWLRVLRAINMF